MRNLSLATLTLLGLALAAASPRSCRADWTTDGTISSSVTYDVEYHDTQKDIETNQISDDSTSTAVQPYTSASSVFLVVQFTQTFTWSGGGTPPSTCAVTGDGTLNGSITDPIEILDSPPLYEFDANMTASSSVAQTGPEGTGGPSASMGIDEYADVENYD